MRLSIVVLAAGLFSVVAEAQQPAAPVAPVRSLPALINDISVRDYESPLVLAAKRTVAARIKNAGRSTGLVIDNAYLQSTYGHVSEAYSAAPLPAYASAPPNIENSGSVSGQRGMNRDAQKRRDALHQEMTRMQNEQFEPYGGDVEEDRLQQRLGTIPGQINNLDRTYGTQPTTVQPTTMQPTTVQPTTVQPSQPQPAYPNPPNPQ